MSIAIFTLFCTIVPGDSQRRQLVTLGVLFVLCALLSRASRKGIVRIVFVAVTRKSGDLEVYYEAKETGVNRPS